MADVLSSDKTDAGLTQSELMRQRKVTDHATESSILVALAVERQ
jgi:hypothetical protein